MDAVIYLTVDAVIALHAIALEIAAELTASGPNSSSRPLCCGWATVAQLFEDLANRVIDQAAFLEWVSNRAYPR